jgi:cobalt-zinc-cadmium efflux system outer membrane protein
VVDGVDSRKFHGLSACLLLGLGGCTTIPRDLGRSDVDALLSERGVLSSAAPAAELDHLLAEPLTPATAIRVALVNNPGLQATFARLGFGAAQVYSASRLSNPSFSAAWLDSDQPGDATQRTLGLAVPFAELLTLSARSRFAEVEFRGLQAAVAHAVAVAAADTEVAFYRLAVDLRLREIRERRATAAELRAELADRFDAAGNITPRELAEIRADAAAAELERLHGEAEVQASRARLAEALGLSTATPWEVDTTLFAPPSDEPSVATLVEQAGRTRLDLIAARAHADMLADRLGFTGWSRWLGDLELGYEREREADGARLKGPTLELEIPLFNQHRDDLLIARADLAEAAANLGGLTLAIENGVRLAYAGVESARARVAVYQLRLVPAHAAVVAETQAEVNFMLTGIFELLEIKQQELVAHEGYLHSVADYWIARAELARAVGASLPVNAGEAIELDIPMADGHEHHHNHGESQ